LHKRCRITESPIEGDWQVLKGETRICGYNYECPEGSYCGSLYEAYDAGINITVPLN
jgi:hypothetical protein